MARGHRGPHLCGRGRGCRSCTGERTTGGSPSRQQTLDELPHVRDAAARGETIHIVEQEPADPAATTTEYGALRLVPSTFAGTLARNRVAQPPADLGVVIEDTEVAKTSPLFKEPRQMLDGFQLVEVRSPFDTIPTNIGVEMLYRSSSGEEIVVRRERVFELPIDLVVDEASEFIVVTVRVLTDGSPVIVYDWRPEAEQLSRGIPAANVVPPDNGFRMVLTYDPELMETIAVEAGRAPSVTIEDLVTILESAK